MCGEVLLFWEATLRPHSEGGENWIPFPLDDDRQRTKKLTITTAAVALAAALDAGRGRGGGSGGVAVLVDEDGGEVVAVVAMGFHSHLCRCSLHVKKMRVDNVRASLSIVYLRTMTTNIIRC